MVVVFLTALGGQLTYVKGNEKKHCHNIYLMEVLVWLGTPAGASLSGG